MNARRSAGSIRKRRPILMKGIFFAHKRFRTVHGVEDNARAAALISSSNGSGIAESIDTIGAGLLNEVFLVLVTDIRHTPVLACHCGFLFQRTTRDAIRGEWRV